MDEPVRVRERQRLEEHGLDDAEDRRVRADRERERRDDDEREARRAERLRAACLKSLIHVSSIAVTCYSVFQIGVDLENAV